MWRPPVIIVFILGLGLFLPACDATSIAMPKLPTTASAATQVGAQAKTGPLVLANGSGNNSGGLQETLHVIVGGGPRAGTYDKSATTGGCSYGLAGTDSFGNQYTDVDEKSGLSSLQMVVPSAKEAANSTPTFNVSFGFGDIQGESATNYEVEGRSDAPPKGKGTVTINDQGTTAQVKIHAEPEEGITIDAQIECKAILRVKR